MSKPIQTTGKQGEEPSKDKEAELPKYTRYVKTQREQCIAKWRDTKNNGAGIAHEKTYETKKYSVERKSLTREKPKGDAIVSYCMGLRPKTTLGNPKPT